MTYSIPLAHPYLPPSVLSRIAAVLESGHLTEGPVTCQLEAAVAAFTGARHAIAVTSCTAGLELTLRALGIAGGEEVIVPGYTYPATAQAVMLTGATAVIVDIDPHTFTIDCNALEAAISPRTRAIMPVSLFGNPLDWDRLNSIARKHDLLVIEDAACGLGSDYKGVRTGAWGTAAVFSLHPRKSLTTGEGGMITTNNDDLALRLRSLKRFGIERLAGERETMCFTQLGSNLKMSDVLAAMGLAQMEEADSLFARRRKLAGRYRTWLAPAFNKDWAHLQETTHASQHAWQSFCLTVPHRNRLLQTLREQGIEVQIGTYALHREPLFQSHPLARLQGTFKNCQYAFDHVLSLPLFHTMTEEQQHTVVAAFLKASPCD